MAIAKKCPEEVSLNSGVMLIRNIGDIKYNTLFIFYVLQSRVFWDWYNSNLTGNSTILHLYQEKFYEFSYMLPCIEEQEKIVEYLKYKLEKIDNLVTKSLSRVEKLAEYKKSLIYECVTGKREVK